MSQMLGNSRTWRWALCACRYCRHMKPRDKTLLKKSARNREDKLWRREQT